MSVNFFSPFTLIILIGLTGNSMTQAQTDSAVNKIAPIKNEFGRKGELFFYWGYNRSAYTKSDIHFKGDRYDFTITDIAAKDEQEPFSSTYYKPNTFTVPQYNYRLGYYINNETFISIGEDHMKYSINKQTTHLTGKIDSDDNNGNNIGDYNNTEIHVGEDGGEDAPSVIDSLKRGFVSEFEHCDGLNDVTIEIGRIEQVWISKNSKHGLGVLGSIGGGLEIPDTHADVLGYFPKHDTGGKTYHLAGYSCSAVIGLEFTFYKNFFLQTRLKGGYINMPDINTTADGGKASQHFNFVESMTVAGYSYVFAKKK